MWGDSIQPCVTTDNCNALMPFTALKLQGNRAVKGVSTSYMYDSYDASTLKSINVSTPPHRSFVASCGELAKHLRAVASL